jgi:hypothetical protein
VNALIFASFRLLATSEHYAFGRLDLDWPKGQYRNTVDQVTMWPSISVLANVF